MPFYYIKYLIKLKKRDVIVHSIDETIDFVIKNRVSVSRYGDGEFLWMMGIPQKSFQDYSEEMRNRLINIIKSNNKAHIVCLPDAFRSVENYNKTAKIFWLRFLGRYRKNCNNYLDLNKEYFNTNMTRLYMDYKKKDECGKRFEKIKQVWVNRDIVIIEGEKTRLGYGNDLFSNTKSISRILAPSTNAYFVYDKILDEALKIDKSKLILIALGPTATILSYDLALNGYQAIDIGHLDIEYEWYLNNALEKIPIKDKFVNESGSPIQDINEIIDDKYINQIIAKVN